MTFKTYDTNNSVLETGSFTIISLLFYFEFSFLDVG